MTSTEVISKTSGVMYQQDVRVGCEIVIMNCLFCGGKFVGGGHFVGGLG